jgi:hypothetical protein
LWWMRWWACEEVLFVLVQAGADDEAAELFSRRQREMGPESSLYGPMLKALGRFENALPFLERSAPMLTAFNSSEDRSAKASSFVFRFLRIRTPDSLPSTRQEPTPFRLVNRVMTNFAFFMFRLPCQLGNLASIKTLIVHYERIEWWTPRDSNPRPPRCKRGALTN